MYMDKGRALCMCFIHVITCIYITCNFFFLKHACTSHIHTKYKFKELYTVNVLYGIRRLRNLAENSFTLR